MAIVGQEDGWLGVFKHCAKAFHGVIAIKWDVRLVSFHGSQHPNDHLWGVW